MIEILKKSIFATIGIALMTRDAVEELGKKIVSEAKLSESEGKQFIDELVKRTDDTRLQLEKVITQQVETALKKVNLVTRKDVESLELRVLQLENKIDQGTA